MENVFLIMCTRHKRAYPCEAKDLYISPFFVLARAIADIFGRRWFILSGKYGLLQPSDWIPPYDVDLAQEKADDWAQWNNRVVDSLVPYLRKTDRVILLANSTYAEGVETILTRQHVLVYWPLQGMSHEQSIQWMLNAQTSEGIWVCGDLPKRDSVR